MNKTRYVKQRINGETAYTNLKQSLFENDISAAMNTDPFTIQTFTTLFYTIIWRRWKANICHIVM